MTDIEKRWTAAATRQLIGRRIILVRYMTQEEADDEGNDGGALYTNNEQNPVLPVI